MSNNNMQQLGTRTLDIDDLDDRKGEEKSNLNKENES